jgi:RNA recognition motif-containing protein
LFKNKLSNTNNALVIFEKQSEAKSCVIKLQNTSVSEGDITFKMTLSPSKEEIEDFSKSKNENFKQRYLNCNLIVKNLPKTMNDRELFEIFREFGEISKAIIPTEGKFVTKLNENGDVVDKEYVYESKGFGFVCFKKTESAELAINNLNGKNLKGKFQDFKVNVEYYNYDRSTEPKEKPQVNKGFHNKKKYGKKNQFHNNNNNANWNENQIKNRIIKV